MTSSAKKYDNVLYTYDEEGNFTPEYREHAKENGIILEPIYLTKEQQQVIDKLRDAEVYKNYYSLYKETLNTFKLWCESPIMKHAENIYRKIRQEGGGEIPVNLRDDATKEYLEKSYAWLNKIHKAEWERFNLTELEKSLIDAREKFYESEEYKLFLDNPDRPAISYPLQIQRRDWHYFSLSERDNHFDLILNVPEKNVIEFKIGENDEYEC